jgi:hypothetical protein
MGARARAVTWWVLQPGWRLQVKTWTPSGQLIACSNHNHAAISCMLATAADGAPSSSAPANAAAAAAPGSGSGARSLSSSRRGSIRVAGAAAGGKLWCGAADGCISVWTDAAGSGRVDQAPWRVLPAQGQKGATRGGGGGARRGAGQPLYAVTPAWPVAVRLTHTAALAPSHGPCLLHSSRRPRALRCRADVKSMCVVGASVWCGCDDGRVLAYHAASEELHLVFRAQPAAVNAMAVVGQQVGQPRGGQHAICLCVCGGGAAAMCSARMHSSARSCRQLR